ncbi:MAG TPA: trypsin-like peptidase domain-containing protein [Acidimicrobiales bacterium]|nr:trypsin-like peptidase domain-containing protein [Acidimicrobiales bacterium]
MSDEDRPEKPEGRAEAVQEPAGQWQPVRGWPLWSPSTNPEDRTPPTTDPYGYPLGIAGAGSARESGREWRDVTWPDPYGAPGRYGAAGSHGVIGHGSASPGSGAERPTNPWGSLGQPPGPVPGEYALYGMPARKKRSPWRSAAMILLVAAAVSAGAGLSRVVWPPEQSAKNASTPGVSGSSGNSNNPGGGSQGGVSGNTGNPFSTPNNGGPANIEAIAAKVDQAIVDINVAFNYQQEQGAGTGIVLTPSGVVLTNNHVVDGATTIDVTDVGNGRTYRATVLGYDNTHDVAVLQLEGARGLKAATPANSPELYVGEPVVALGNAGGTGGTPTSAGGSITALDQSITATDELNSTNEQLTGLIEVDANIESGDSGGPLVNAAGQVIGMDTAASAGFNFSSQGNEGFAIPVNQAMRVVHTVQSGKGNSIIHVGPTGFIGILEPPSQDNFGFGFPGFPGFQTYPQVAGVDVGNVVTGGPAQHAGIAGGDVITSFAGVAVTSPGQLTHLMVSHHPGDKVEITWVESSGQSHTAIVQLASGPPA